MKSSPSFFRSFARRFGRGFLQTGLAAIALAFALAASAGELVISGPITISNPISVGPIMPIDPVPPIGGNFGNFVSLNEQLTFAAPAVTTTTSSTTTTSAPSASGSINASTVSGNSTVDFFGINSISIYTRNLPADTYTISTTTISTGASITLGTLTIPTVSPIPPIVPIAFGGGSGNGDGVHTNGVVVDPIIPIDPFRPPGSIVFGTFGTPLPTGFNLFDVATVTITNSSNVVVLTSTASPVANGELKATSAVTPGADATSAKGAASLTAIATEGKVKGILFLHASGVPASTTYTYAINGADVGSVTTSPKGRLSVYKTTGQKKSPLTDPFGITSITVHDGSGNAVVSATF